MIRRNGKELTDEAADFEIARFEATDAGDEIGYISVEGFNSSSEGSARGR
jgi:hypothetical protein